MLRKAKLILLCNYPTAGVGCVLYCLFFDLYQLTTLNRSVALFAE